MTERTILDECKETLSSLEKGQTDQLVKLAVLDERTKVIKDLLERQNGRITWLERRDWILGVFVLIVGVIAASLGIIIP